MKVARAPLHSPTVEQVLVRDPEMVESASGRRAIIEVTAIYEEHAEFLWRSLQHLGVREADLEDAVQEVLVVVHRRRNSYNFDCRLTTWLFGICLRIASRHRRRAYFRREHPSDVLPEQIDQNTPEDRLIERRAKLKLEALLQALSPEHRAAFVMFELEGQSCQEIADLFGVPIGTIYSRLNNARKLVDRAVLRERAKSQKGGLS